MTRKYDMGLLGEDYQLELTPELLAFEMSMGFSDQVIKRCSELDLSLGQLAERLDIGLSTLSEKLNGQNMTLKSMASIALALGRDAEAPELIPLEAEEVEASLPDKVVFDRICPWTTSIGKPDYEVFESDGADCECLNEGIRGNVAPDHKKIKPYRELLKEAA